MPLTPALPLARDQEVNVVSNTPPPVPPRKVKKKIIVEREDVDSSKLYPIPQNEVLPSNESDEFELDDIEKKAMELFKNHPLLKGESKRVMQITELTDDYGTLEFKMPRTPSRVNTKEKEVKQVKPGQRLKTESKSDASINRSSFFRLRLKKESKKSQLRRNKSAPVKEENQFSYTKESLRLKKPKRKTDKSMEEFKPFFSNSSLRKLSHREDYSNTIRRQNTSVSHHTPRSKPSKISRGKSRRKASIFFEDDGFNMSFVSDAEKKSSVMRASNSRTPKAAPRKRRIKKRSSKQY